MFHLELSTIGKVAFPLFTEEVAKSQRTFHMGYFNRTNA